MYKSKESNVKPIFQAIDASMSIYGVLCLARCEKHICKRASLKFKDCGCKKEERQYCFHGMHLSYRAQYRKERHGCILKNQSLYY